MTKYQFMKILEASLKNLPTVEREDMMQDFEEHFLAGMEEGKSEEEIASALGSPQQIAKEYLATYHLGKVQSKTSVGNILRAVWATIGLGFLNLLIVLGPFIAILSLLLTGWALAVGFTASPILLLMNTIFNPGTTTSFDLFSAMALTGAGLLTGIGMFYATRWMIIGFVKYLKFNVRIVKGGLTT